MNGFGRSDEPTVFCRTSWVAALWCPGRRICSHFFASHPLKVRYCLGGNWFCAPLSPPPPPFPLFSPLFLLAPPPLFYKFFS
eukprot:jgi/Botrbrau1/828/Bobra.0352s0025.1